MTNGHDEKPNKDDGFEGRTYLFIRTNPSDTGGEPLASGLKHWKSPDIVVVQPDGTRGTEAVGGQENQVEVMVTNAGGIDANDTYVDVFFADPSTAFTPATATLIGGDYLDIPGYNHRVIGFPWIPGPGDEGHRCLLARVALYVPFDAYADGTIFDVRGDRHVAQRNIHVLEMEEVDTLRFGFAIVNPIGEAVKMRVSAREVRDVSSQQRLGRALGCGLVQFGEKPLETFKLDLGNERVELPKVLDPRERLAAELRLEGLGPLSPVGLSRPRSRFTTGLKPREVRQALLWVKRSETTRPGDVHAIDITQTSEDGTTVGGLTVIVRH